MILKRRKAPKMGCNEAPQIRCASHLAWVRGHCCVVCGTAGDMQMGRIEAAHTRNGTDGGTSLKPGDNWTLPLCSYHHAMQHRMGESHFEARYKISMKAIAAALWNASPHGRRYRTTHQGLTT